jgi:hypothetical protein
MPNVLGALSQPRVGGPGSALPAQSATGTQPVQPPKPPRPGLLARTKSALGSPLGQIGIAAVTGIAPALLADGGGGSRVALPRTQTASVGAAEAAERERRRRLGRGRASTILTSPQGVTGSSNVAVKRLLG